MMYQIPKMQIQKVKINPNTVVFFSCFVFVGLFNMMTSLSMGELSIRAFESTPKHCNVNGGKPVPHDKDPVFLAQMKDSIQGLKQDFDDYEMPDIAVVSSSFFFHTTDPTETIGSNFPSLSRAWNETFAVTDHESIINAKSDIWGSQGLNDEIIKSSMSGGIPVRELEDGKYTAFSGWLIGNFGHFVHDFASKIAWLKTLLSEDTMFLIPHHPIYEDVLSAVDEEFVRERIRWVTYGESVYVKNGSLTVMVPKSNLRFPGGYPQTATIFTEHFRRWLEESHWSGTNALTPELRRKVIFYSRKGSTVRRNVEDQLEKILIQKILSAMEKRGQSQDDLIIFNGKDNDGNTLPVETQREIFRRADTAIGPHGSGLTNVIWMDPRCGSAASRPKVLEFTSSARTKVIQSGSYWGYWFLFGSMPWLNYHYIYYTPESSDATVYVDVDVFENTLHDMWGIH